MKKILLTLLAIGLVACSKEDEPTSSNDTNTIPTPTSTAYTYFVGKIDNKVAKYEAFISTDTKYIGIYGTSTSNFPVYNINYSGGIESVSFGNDESIDIDFVNFMKGVDGITESTHEKEFFDKLFKVGNYNFVSSGTDNKDKLGISITREFEGRNFYSGNLQPSSSYFKILTVSSPEFQDGGVGQKIITITGVFSCRLFDTSDVTKYTDLEDMSFKIMIKSDKSLM